MINCWFLLQVNEITWNKQNHQFFLTNGNGCVVICHCTSNSLSLSLSHSLALSVFLMLLLPPPPSHSPSLPIHVHVSPSLPLSPYSTPATHLFPSVAVLLPDSYSSLTFSIIRFCLFPSLLLKFHHFMSPFIAGLI